MRTTPTIDQVVDFFDAHTVELYPDVRDRVAYTVTDIRSGDGSTVRFYNAVEEEFMKLRTAVVSKRFQPLSTRSWGCAPCGGRPAVCDSVVSRPR